MAEEQSLHHRTSTVLRRLVRRDAGPAVRKVIAKTRPADVSAAMEHLTHAEKQRLFQLIDDPDFRAEVLSYLSDSARPYVLAVLEVDELVDLLGRMEPDDATDIVEILPDEVRAAVVAELRGSDTEEVSVLLAYDSDTAGGIMSPVVFTMPAGATCGRAIESLQERHDELDSVFYLYVVEDERRLVGVVSLRTLLVHPASTPLVSIMTKDVITVAPQQDQEDVARIVSRYDLLGVPVVDDERNLLGIVTVDDVVDVIRDEVVEDMMRLAGVHEELKPGSRSVFRAVRQRAGWLLATLFGGIIASELVGFYESSLAQMAILAGFIPVVMGMGGNVGIQSATITVRGLATGHVQIGGTLWFILREARVGMVLGVLYGTLLGGYALARFWWQPMVAVSVASSILLAVTAASLFGTGVPVVLAKLGIDPAVATGPFVTTMVDIFAILIYFNIARTLIVV